MKIHVVKKGDTLYFIAQKHNVSIEDILKLNPSITNPDLLDVGMKLKVPSANEVGGGTGGLDIMHQHVVKQGDTLWKLSKAWGVPLADMIKANPQLKNPNVLLTGEIVNIPKTATPTEVQGNGGGVTAQGTGNAHHPLHPMSLMHGVQNWVGKKPTGQMPAAQAPVQKTPTAPIAPVAPTEKTPTAPIVTPVAPAAKEQPAKKALPIQKSPGKKANHAEEAANVKPNMKPNMKPAMEANVQPNMKPNVSPIMQSKPEPKLQPSVDLFKQFGIPAVEAASQPHHGYGNMAPMVSPLQVGPGFGYGHGGWPGSNVSPASEGPWCPPGTMPIAAGPGYGYGMGNVSPAVFGSENASPVLGAENVSPAATGNNAAPAALGSNAAPTNVSPAAVSPTQGYGFVSPANVGPEHGYGYGPTAVSPAEMGPGYGWPGAVSPAEMGPGYGWP
ncbi:LysM peptidoglycan-binding domain-containing protein, partial [Paenibacillus sp. ATY16]|uniref:LysM peptidoglycan-binding domain-containing protein n=1 Tax=Paenibacillus sp. ATY16 TaxID=1759312 RepID=UPI00200FC449|nr:LysM peptidoglycan-binding domain-containing protein [Paenibacillus sp. ATY16]